MNNETLSSEHIVSRRVALGALGVAGLGAVLYLANEVDARDRSNPNVSRFHRNPDNQSSSQTEIHSDTTEVKLDNTIWEQDFTDMQDGPVDSKYWSFDLDPEIPGYNNEAQVYTDSPENVRIENGELLIEAHKSTTGYTSARISTKGKVTIEQGNLVEVTARLPKGAGAWPAVWMLSDNEPFTANATAVDWNNDQSFYAKNGEIDFLEAMGSDPSKVYPAVHSYDSVKAGKGSIVDMSESVADATEVEHNYGVLWLDNKLQFLLDGEVLHTVEKQGDTPEAWPFRPENKMHLIVNLAMGGTMGGPINDTPGSWQLAISKIRISKDN